MALTEQLREEHRNRWQAWLHAAADQGLLLEPDDALSKEIEHVWEGSDYVAQSCIRYPGLLLELVESGDLQRSYPIGEMDSRLRL
ncbi:MAG: bifunctional glutamine synthetase adenylyltransferase/deadenyltransferase, partial [Gammaproteobacteria bacterium]|nr:bifunctional glutamine synthetase adenylyltransferase/deadenyltransferase [Gammaproteobacteria bacterium]